MFLGASTGAIWLEWRALIEQAVKVDDDDKAGWARAVLLSAAKRTIAKNKEATSK